MNNVPSFDLCWVAEQKATSAHQRPRAGCVEATIRNGLAYIRQIRAIAGQGGHNATFRAACKLRDSGLTADEAMKALLLWNETNASPVWSAKELAHKYGVSFDQLRTLLDDRGVLDPELFDME